MEVHEITNFVDYDTCDQIVEEILITPLRENHETQPFFWNRTRGIDKFPSSSLLKSIRDKMLNVAKVLYNQNSLVVDYVDVVTWYDGQEMKPHSDSVDIHTGIPYAYCSSRIYSGVLYLNDDYEGGETYFPNLNKSVKPLKGKFVLFPANVEYTHGVNKISTKNYRYTMPIWFKKL